ncbi:MAG TPA: DUF1552 domain-containing protein [Polyangiaceae bacterium]|jgi:hypothetical protein|nr:DUF1552 domain-containing protein [Polyangiaceae bacterium]
MMRRQGTLTRRDLIKCFGPLAFLLMPIAKSMGYAKASVFAGAPRFVHFFKGPSYHSPTISPTTAVTSLPAPLAPLAPHAQDIILFSGMSIHGGSPKTDGYQEEHGAGLIGTTTGHSYHYSKNDSYYAYTDNESIDIAIANQYQTVPALAALPFASLHLGAGAQSDADNIGLGQRYISYRKRQPADALYGNAIEPVQDVGQVYDLLMQRINAICVKDSGQPGTDTSKLRAALERKKSLIDFRLADITDAKRALGMDSVHAQKLDGLVDGWRQVEKGVNAELAGLGDAGTGGTMKCPTTTKPTGTGASKNNCDQLSPVADQMIALIKLAFEWDLTRVVAFTLSGASSGHRWPAQGVDKAHHSLEHSNDVAGQNIMGRYFSEKFALLLTALKSIDDGGGKTALFNTSVMLGMECWSDSSNGHYLKNIPFVFAGQGGGAFQTGRIIAAGGRNNNDLLISIQNASGIASNVFGLASLCKGPIL